MKNDKKSILQFSIATYISDFIFTAPSGLILSFKRNTLQSRNTYVSLNAVEDKEILYVFVVLEHIITKDGNKIVSYLCIKIAGRTVFDLQATHITALIDRFKLDFEKEGLEYAF